MGSLWISWLVMAGIAVTTVFVCWRSIAKMRRELDDQGIRVAQIDNRNKDIKDTLSRLDNQLQQLSDWIEGTRVLNIDKINESVDEADEATVRTMDSVLNQPKARAERAGWHDGNVDQQDNDFDQSATNVLYKNAKTYEDDDEDIDDQRTIREPIQHEGDGGKSKKARIRKTFDSLDHFIDLVGDTLTRNGMFYPSKTQLPPGTRVVIDLHLRDGSSIIAGKGAVIATPKDRDESGMQIEFTDLDRQSKDLIKRIRSQND